MNSYELIEVANAKNELADIKGVIEFGKTLTKILPILVIAIFFIGILASGIIMKICCFICLPISLLTIYASMKTEVWKSRLNRRGKELERKLKMNLEY